MPLPWLKAWEVRQYKTCRLCWENKTMSGSCTLSQQQYSWQYINSKSIQLSSLSVLISIRNSTVKQWWAAMCDLHRCTAFQNLTSDIQVNFKTELPSKSPVSATTIVCSLSWSSAEAILLFFTSGSDIVHCKFPLNMNRLTRPLLQVACDCSRPWPK